jgi:hypothetical protein
MGALAELLSLYFWRMQITGGGYEHYIAPVDYMLTEVGYAQSFYYGF